MITRFKIFEELNDDQVGNYAIISFGGTASGLDDNLNDFLNNSIGYIWKNVDEKLYFIKYYNIPKNTNP